MKTNVLTSGVRRTTVNSLLGIAITAVAACSPGAANPSPSSTPPTRQDSTPPSTTLSGVDKAKQDAVASYRGMWKDFVAAGITSDWQSPTLGRYATGIALTNLSRGLYADHSNGLITKGEPTLSPSVSSVDSSAEPKRIIVTDCGDSTRWLKYRADNGQLADDKPGGRQLINAIVDKQADGSWKVSDFGVHGVGTC